MKFVDIPDASKITGDPVNRTTIISDGKIDRKSTRLNSSHSQQSRMPSSA